MEDRVDCSRKVRRTRRAIGRTKKGLEKSESFKLVMRA